MTRILTIIALLFATPANAIPLKSYRVIEQVEEYRTVYLQGVADGLLWGESPLFCPPSDLAVDVNLIRSALETGVREFSIDGTPMEDLYSGWVIVVGLSKMFPCEEK